MNLTNREIFWKFVEIGLLKSSLPPAKVIDAFRRVWRTEIDLFIGGWDAPDPKALSLKAAEYVTWAQGGPTPSWLVPFLNNWPD